MDAWMEAQPGSRAKGFSLRTFDSRRMCRNKVSIPCFGWCRSIERVRERVVLGPLCCFCSCCGWIHPQANMTKLRSFILTRKAAAAQILSDTTGERLIRCCGVDACRYSLPAAISMPDAHMSWRWKRGNERGNSCPLELPFLIACHHQQAQQNHQIGSPVRPSVHQAWPQEHRPSPPHPRRYRVREVCHGRSLAAAADLRPQP